jgi:hypothetical protein
MLDFVTTKTKILIPMFLLTAIGWGCDLSELLKDRLTQRT